MPEKFILRQYQALPLRAKVTMSLNRIREWHDHFGGNVVISYSGGKDSTVLAHLVHEMFPNVPMVFANTGLEFPEIQSFARKMGAEFIRPKMSFSEVISTYGYPVIGKENAEAIYYARRIRNLPGGGVQEETVPAWKSSDPANGTRSSTEFTGTRKIPGGGYSTTVHHRNEINGSRVDEYTEEPPKIRCGGTESSVRQNGMETGKPDGHDTEQQETKTGWKDWRRNVIAGVGAFEPGKTSIFNKSKWLPLCRDTQFLISHKCCAVMKKGPMRIYQRKHKVYPYLGTLTEESKLREQAWVRHGCNAFDAAIKTSQPMSFWAEQDVLHYIYEEGLEIASVYGDIVAVDKNGVEYEPYFVSGCNLKCTGCQRTGCVFCLFGMHLEKGETRLQKLAKTHPKQYEYCLRGGQWVDNPYYDPAAPEKDGDWVNWNPKKIWVPSKEGLGMKKVMDDCNQIYGKDFYRYE